MKKIGIFFINDNKIILGDFMYQGTGKNANSILQKLRGINALNVGVDMINYKPISTDDIVKIVNEREMSL